MTELQVNNIFFCYELSSKHNVYIIGSTLYIWKQHIFETIFTFNDVLNIQYAIGKGLGYQERAYYMGVNAYFFPRRKNGPHATPSYGPEN